MSKKRREDQEKRKPLELSPLRIAIGVAVVVLSAAVAVTAFTLLGGASLSEGGKTVKLPPVGSPVAAERSAAADLLANKTWDEMSADEQALAESEFNRVFENTEFRASSARIIGIDIFRRDGHTRISRQYSQLKEGVPSNEGQDVAESLIFYCPSDNSQIHAIRYDKTPLKTQVGEAIQEPRAQPWDIIISGINWEQGVSDLGWRDFEGMRLHGLRVVYNSNQPEVPGNRKEADYWFDQETARLIQRQPVIPDANTEDQLYTLQWRALPTVEVPADQPRLDCVGDVLAKVAG